MSATPLKTFIIYARNDKAHKDDLLRHLKPLVATKMLHIWHDADMKPGEEWELAIKHNLKTSDIILVLVSSHSLASDFIQTDELETAISQVQQETSRIIQIIVSPCSWKFSPVLSKLQGLPENMKPITKWENHEEAWTNVIDGIADVVSDIHLTRAEIERKAAKLKRLDEEIERKRLKLIEAQKHLQELRLRKAKEDPFHGLMVKIPAGSFEMGSNDFEYTQPIHKVTLKYSFEICKYQVTQKQWQTIMGNNPSHFKGEDLPVEYVSWDDIQIFLQKLNEKTGKNYRLPSEAEWEYAAKGGQNYKYVGSDNINEVAWYDGNSGDKRLLGKLEYKKILANNGKTHPVGKKKPNGYGLYDMSGNVWEWCEDKWYRDYKDAPNDGSAWLLGGSSQRVRRGGSFLINSDYARLPVRYGVVSLFRWYDLGFRLCHA